MLAQFFAIFVPIYGIHDCDSMIGTHMYNIGEMVWNVVWKSR